MATRRRRVVAALLTVLTVGCASTLQHQSPTPGTTTSAGTQPVTLVGTPGVLTPTGRGWDRSSIYVGVLTEDDAQRVAEGLGLANLDPGNQEADAEAAAAEINHAGGIFGRKIVLEFYNENTFALLASPDTQAAGACTHFTEDQPVVAVINSVTIIDTPAFRTCFATNHVPLFEGSQQPTDTQALLGYGGYVISVLSPSYTDMAPTLVRRLNAMGYFSPWNVDTGTPGTSPVKVGILTPHDPTGAAAAQLLAAALTKIGHPPVDIFSYSSSGAGSGTESSAAFQFHAKGITHVIGTGLNSYLFMQPAQAQQYHPRYGVSTFNAPGVLFEDNVPKAQLVGSLGIGVDPTGDVDEANDPGNVSPAETSCLATMHSAGQNFAGKRVAEAVGLFDCDAFRLLKASAVAGHGLNSASLVTGVQKAGPNFVPAETFSSGLGEGRFALAGSARDLGWNVGCQCYRYLSTTNYRVH